MEDIKQTLKTFTWNILGLIYSPIYIICFILHKIARIFLAISYLGMFEPRMAKDIIKSLFMHHGKH